MAFLLVLSRIPIPLTHSLKTFIGSVGCTSEEFSCDNQRCVPSNQRSNGVDDCGDESDERNCRKYTCLLPDFRAAQDTQKTIRTS